MFDKEKDSNDENKLTWFLRDVFFFGELKFERE
jgi:hypothetical protein